MSKKGHKNGCIRVEMARIEITKISWAYWGKKCKSL